MTLYYEKKGIQIYHGDCCGVLKLLADCSVDSVVTDPPYELGFMGKAWDRSGITYQVDVWRECLRILKPGGHLLAFGGSRTYHRLACAIEDAGFEIRDQIQWIYGSGFPKSLDVSKAIDAASGAKREIIGVETLRYDMRGNASNGKGISGPNRSREPLVRNITATATDAAKQWNGWGTALKPAHEPIVLARKPLIGTVAENVLQHGTGGLNIDGCRIETNGDASNARKDKSNRSELRPSQVIPTALDTPWDGALGRWPANVIHDGSEEVLTVFPDTDGQGGGVRGNEPSRSFGNVTSGPTDRQPFPNRGDTGNAARFFYCAKASREDRSEGLDALTTSPRSIANMTTRAEREGREHRTESASRNHHPTVKPTDLMRYLCRLVTPPNGTVLDPFCGSGSTGRGAILEGLNFIGIEIDAEYCELAEKRIEAVTKQGAFCFTECAEGLASGL